MQVRKFEAKTMKEALEMVKSQLGPEAIIMSAREKTQRFGLAGDQSVEITAAVPERVLLKKQMAERKLGLRDKESFQRSSARQQKSFIDRSYKQDHPTAEDTKAWKNRRYIDIPDDELAVEPAPARRDSVSFSSARDVQSDARQQPIKREAPEREEFATTLAANEGEVGRLKSEISRLNKVIEQFQKVPQSFISIHPGAEKGVPFELSAIFDKLKSVGLQEDLIIELLKECQGQLSSEQLKKRPLVEGWVAKRILENTKVVEKPTSGRVHIFSGPSGHGKTACLVKLAGLMAIQERKKVGIVTADFLKVGGADQLKIFAQILNTPFATVREPSDWPAVLKSLSDCDHILVDFPAISLKSIDEIEWAKKLLPPPGSDARLHLVVSATSKDHDLAEMVRRHSVLRPDDVIFTSIDEAVQHGVIYNFQKKFGWPLHSFGLGPKIPEDYEMASRERVVDLLFKLTNLKKREETSEYASL